MNSCFALMGTSPTIRHVQHLVFKVTELDTPIIITGESGTGKDLVAKMIHERSPRASQPFVVIKCAALSEEMLEYELFGDSSSTLGNGQHRPGALVLSGGGTVYLDEISKLSLKLQTLLLKAIQEKAFLQPGSDTQLPFYSRFICSSSQDLDTLVRRGAFKEELFYKLSAAAIYLPPLRERREDIPVISEHLVQKYSSAKGKKISGISHDALNAMLQNNWANNIQELENLIERIVVLKNSGSIEITDLPPRLRNLVTDNVDTFYDRANHMAKAPAHQMNAYPGANHMYSHNAPAQNFAPTQNMQPANFINQNAVAGRPGMMNSYSQNQNPNSMPSSPYGNSRTMSSVTSQLRTNVNMFDEMPCEIDQFIKKDIDLGSGIDFYRVVEEFENKLIAEALRRTNHNKNRAAQLLSMNRTTLVEKLKKRASSTTKMDSGRVKRNSAFTIFDGLGDDGSEFDGIDFVNLRHDDNP